jgi:hypothetical protein
MGQIYLAVKGEGFGSLWFCGNIAAFWALFSADNREILLQFESLPTSPSVDEVPPARQIVLGEKDLRPSGPQSVIA